jgi:hypothetical protein
VIECRRPEYDLNLWRLSLGGSLEIFAQGLEIISGTSDK